MIVNGRYYRDVLLIQGLLPDIRTFSEYYTFQEDSAPAHRVRETVELLGNETSDSIPPTLWQPNSPDLNPVDYRIWSVMRVYRTKVRDIEDLRQRIMQVWDEFDQASLMRQSSNGVRVSAHVLQQMADSLNINFEWNIITTT